MKTDNMVWTVLGGWAVPPAVLESIFGKNSNYIDINPLIPSLFDKGTLVPDWIQRLKNILEPRLSMPLYLAGWSTGAILSLSLASVLNPVILVLLSATHTFCRKDNFHFGTRRSVLESMRTSLAVDRENVLKGFYARCGMDGKLHSVPYTTAELEAGLRFLEQAAFSTDYLLTLGSLPFQKLIFHGSRDMIIPCEAGEYLCRAIDGSFHKYDGPHLFFDKYHKEIKSAIDTTV